MLEAENGKILFESVAICAYLLKKGGKTAYTGATAF
jgi:glutathione S-transferase